MTSISLCLSQTGIEVKFKNQNFPILIASTHIPELNAVKHTSDGIKFGASLTLTTLEDVLNEACHSMPGKLRLQIREVCPLEGAGNTVVEA